MQPGRGRSFRPRPGRFCFVGLATTTTLPILSTRRLQSAIIAEAVADAPKCVALQEAS